MLFTRNNTFISSKLKKNVHVAYRNCQLKPDIQLFINFMLWLTFNFDQYKTTVTSSQSHLRPHDHWVKHFLVMQYYIKHFNGMHSNPNIRNSK